VLAIDDAVTAHFQSGRARWGAESLAACDRTPPHTPGFPAARFAATMVFVARQAYLPALAAATAGAEAQSRHGEDTAAVPAIGLHWLRGLLLLRERQIGLSIEAFAREIDELREGQAYAPEVRVHAQVAAGYAHMAAGDTTGAVDVFRMSLEAVPRSGRALAGLYTALQKTSLAREAATLLSQIDQRVVELRSADRTAEAALVTAAAHGARGELEAGCETLVQLLDVAPPGQAGWQIPIDPALAPLRAHQRFATVLAMLAARAA
jgi:tetratricopeptide (TPR) repeat protein